MNAANHADDLIAELLPGAVRSLEAARDAIAELADLLSDAHADWVADQGGVGCRTPQHVVRLYGFADECHRMVERLERWGR